MDEVIVLSSGTDDEESILKKNSNDKRFQAIWEAAKVVLFSKTSNKDDVPFPHSSLKDLFIVLSKKITEITSDSLKAFVFRNILQWLQAMKLAYDGLVYDEKFNLILVDFMALYINYKCMSNYKTDSYTTIEHVINEILTSLHIIFNGKSTFLIMTLLKIDARKDFASILYPIFKKLLTDRRLVYSSNEMIRYILLILGFKKWRLLVSTKEDKEEIYAMAEGKSEAFIFPDGRKNECGVIKRILPRKVPTVDNTNKPFTTISDLIGFAIKRGIAGTRILLTNPSMDFPLAIEKYFKQYEHYINRRHNCELYESTQRLDINKHDVFQLNVTPWVKNNLSQRQELKNHQSTFENQQRATEGGDAKRIAKMLSNIFGTTDTSKNLCDKTDERGVNIINRFKSSGSINNFSILVNDESSSSNTKISNAKFTRKKLRRKHDYRVRSRNTCSSSSSDEEIIDERPRKTKPRSNRNAQTCRVEQLEATPSLTLPSLKVRAASSCMQGDVSSTTYLDNQNSDCNQYSPTSNPGQSDSEKIQSNVANIPETSRAEPSTECSRESSTSELCSIQSSAYIDANNSSYPQDISRSSSSSLRLQSTGKSIKYCTKPKNSFGPLACTEVSSSEIENKRSRNDYENETALGKSVSPDQVNSCQQVESVNNTVERKPLGEKLSEDKNENKSQIKPSSSSDCLNKEKLKEIEDEKAKRRQSIMIDADIEWAKIIEKCKVGEQLCDKKQENIEDCGAETVSDELKGKENVGENTECGKLTKTEDEGSFPYYIDDTKLPYIAEVECESGSCDIIAGQELFDINVPFEGSDQIERPIVQSAEINERLNDMGNMNEKVSSEKSKISNMTYDGNVNNNVACRSEEQTVVNTSPKVKDTSDSGSNQTSFEVTASSLIQSNISSENSEIVLTDCGEDSRSIVQTIAGNNARVIDMGNMNEKVSSEKLKITNIPYDGNVNNNTASRSEEQTVMNTSPKAKDTSGSGSNQTSFEVTASSLIQSNIGAEISEIVLTDCGEDKTADVTVSKCPVNKRMEIATEEIASRKSPVCTALLSSTHLRSSLNYVLFEKSNNELRANSTTFCQHLVKSTNVTNNILKIEASVNSNLVNTAAGIQGSDREKPNLINKSHVNEISNALGDMEYNMQDTQTKVFENSLDIHSVEKTKASVTVEVSDSLIGCRGDILYDCSKPSTVSLDLRICKGPPSSTYFKNKNNKLESSVTRFPISKVECIKESKEIENIDKKPISSLVVHETTKNRIFGKIRKREHKKYKLNNSNEVQINNSVTVFGVSVSNVNSTPLTKIENSLVSCEKDIVADTFVINSLVDSDELKIGEDVVVSIPTCTALLNSTHLRQTLNHNFLTALISNEKTEHPQHDSCNAKIPLKLRLKRKLSACYTHDMNICNTDNILGENSIKSVSEIDSLKGKLTEVVDTANGITNSTSLDNTYDSIDFDFTNGTNLTNESNSCKKDHVTVIENRAIEDDATNLLLNKINSALDDDKSNDSLKLKKVSMQDGTLNKDNVESPDNSKKQMWMENLGLFRSSYIQYGKNKNSSDLKMGRRKKAKIVRKISDRNEKSLFKGPYTSNIVSSLSETSGYNLNLLALAAENLTVLDKPERTKKSKNRISRTRKKQTKPKNDNNEPHRRTRNSCTIIEKNEIENDLKSALEEYKPKSAIKKTSSQTSLKVRRVQFDDTIWQHIPRDILRSSVPTESTIDFSGYVNKKNFSNRITNISKCLKPDNHTDFNPNCENSTTTKSSPEKNNTDFQRENVKPLSTWGVAINQSHQDTISSPQDKCALLTIDAADYPLVEHAKVSVVKDSCQEDISSVSVEVLLDHGEEIKELHNELKDQRKINQVDKVLKTEVSARKRNLKSKRRISKEPICKELSKKKLICDFSTVETVYGDEEETEETYNKLDVNKSDVQPDYALAINSSSEVEDPITISIQSNPASLSDNLKPNNEICKDLITNANVESGSNNQVDEVSLNTFVVPFKNPDVVSDIVNAIVLPTQILAVSDQSNEDEPIYNESTFVQQQEKKKIPESKPCSVELPAGQKNRHVKITSEFSRCGKETSIKDDRRTSDEHSLNFSDGKQDLRIEEKTSEGLIPVLKTCSNLENCEESDTQILEVEQEIFEESCNLIESRQRAISSENETEPCAEDNLSEAQQRETVDSYKEDIESAPRHVEMKTIEEPASIVTKPCFVKIRRKRNIDSAKRDSSPSEPVIKKLNCVSYSNENWDYEEFFIRTSVEHLKLKKLEQTMKYLLKALLSQPKQPSIEIYFILNKIIITFMQESLSSEDCSKETSGRIYLYLCQRTKELQAENIDNVRLLEIENKYQTLKNNTKKINTLIIIQYLDIILSKLSTIKNNLFNDNWLQRNKSEIQKHIHMSPIENVIITRVNYIQAHLSDDVHNEKQCKPSLIDSHNELCSTVDEKKTCSSLNIESTSPKVQTNSLCIIPSKNISLTEVSEVTNENRATSNIRTNSPTVHSPVCDSIENELPSSKINDQTEMSVASDVDTEFIDTMNKLYEISNNNSDSIPKTGFFEFFGDVEVHSGSKSNNIVSGNTVPVESNDTWPDILLDSYMQDFVDPQNDINLNQRFSNEDFLGTENLLFPLIDHEMMTNFADDQSTTSVTVRIDQNMKSVNPKDFFPSYNRDTVQRKPCQTNSASLSFLDITTDTNTPDFLYSHGDVLELPHDIGLPKEVKESETDNRPLCQSDSLFNSIVEPTKDNVEGDVKITNLTETKNDAPIEVHSNMMPPPPQKNDPKKSKIIMKKGKGFCVAKSSIASFEQTASKVTTSHLTQNSKLSLTPFPPGKIPIRVRSNAIKPCSPKLQNNNKIEDTTEMDVSKLIVQSSTQSFEVGNKELIPSSMRVPNDSTAHHLTTMLNNKTTPNCIKETNNLNPKLIDPNEIEKKNITPICKTFLKDKLFSHDYGRAGILFVGSMQLEPIQSKKSNVKAHRSGFDALKHSESHQFPKTPMKRKVDEICKTSESRTTLTEPSKNFINRSDDKVTSNDCSKQKPFDPIPISNEKLLEILKTQNKLKRFDNSNSNARLQPNMTK